MKRKIIGMLVMVAVMGMLGAMPVMAGEITAPDKYVFTTDASGVIQIGGVEALTEFSKYVNDEGGNPAANAVLTADITLNATDGWKHWGPDTTGLTVWTPIGNGSKPYTGDFDGGNHTISGIYINDPDATEGQGLFGECSSDIKDLKVTASYINAQNYVGGIAGLIRGGSISNCQVEANLDGGKTMGGIVGHCGSATITSCSFNGSVSGGMGGSNGIGGICGLIISGSIINCYNTADVTGYGIVGGIVGQCVTGRVENCANTGAIAAENSIVGGIAGCGYTASIANCYQTGAVTGADALTGGILGKDANDANCSNCYYLSGSAVWGASHRPAFGIGNSSEDADGQTVAKTAAAFASGEVAYRLNNYSSFGANWHHWTQNPGVATPSLAPDGSNIIDKKITLDYADPDADLVFYGAVGSTLVGLPSPPAAATYAYTKTSPADGTVYSQAEMASYQLTAVDDLVFTVKAYQLAVNNEGVIEIDTPAELTEFAKYVNDGNTGANGKLTADIALNVTTGWEHWRSDTSDLTAWTPIGNHTKPYTGDFDGGNHTISGIYINAPTLDSQGLFGECINTDIKDLKVTASYINTQKFVGGIVGWMRAGSITNCQVEAKLVGNSDVGGIVGLFGGTISGSSYRGSVTGDCVVGGIVGCEFGKISIINCYNTADVNGTRYVGGIIGYMNGGQVENCANTGAVTGADALTGGILGENGNGTTTSNCYYLSGSAVNASAGTPVFGLGDTTTDVGGQTEAKAADAFASGEVAWRLQQGQPDSAVPVWGQRLTGSEVDALPLLKGSDPVCQVTFAAGNGYSAETQAYVNQNGTVTPAPPATGYVWQDSSQAVFTAASVVTGDISVRCEIAALPTAAAVYGTKPRDIEFSGGSVPAANWSWAEDDKDTVLAVGNTTAYPATYTPTDAGFDPKTVAITPVISARSLSADGVIISQPANVYYTGAAIEPLINVTDSGAVITAADYSISYTNNTSPGTATVTITGQGNYQGEVTRTFTITATGGGGGYTPPGMSGITVTPRVISFDPSGQLVVDISGLPPEATVYYSLDGITYSTTPPAMTRAGEYPLYLRITCPGYQDFSSQTLVTVAKQSPPQVRPIALPMPPQLRQFTIPLGQGLPLDRGQTGFQLGTVDDPGGLLDGPPTIAADGAITCNFRRPRSTAADDTSQPADQAPAGAADGLETAAKTATIAVLVSMENYEDTTLTVVVSEAEPLGVRYLTHIQDLGWETDWVTTGDLSGTTGQSKRLEALKVELTGDVPAGASIETAVHVQDLGDLGPFAMGSAAGTSGQSLRLENICLTLQNLPGYSLRYNVHVQDQGWLRDEADPSSWFSSGEVAGTSGKSRRLEGIRIVLVKDE